MSPFNEKDALAYDPFGMDFGEPGDVRLRDEIRTARKEHDCHACGELVLKGQRYRNLTGKFGGELREFKYCYYCCVAMAKSWTDDGRALEHRFRIREAVYRIKNAC